MRSVTKIERRALSYSIEYCRETGDHRNTPCMPWLGHWSSSYRSWLKAGIGDQYDMLISDLSGVQGRNEFLESDHFLPSFITIHHMLFTIYCLRWNASLLFNIIFFVTSIFRLSALHADTHLFIRCSTLMKKSEEGICGKLFYFSSILIPALKMNPEIWISRFTLPRTFSLIRATIQHVERRDKICNIIVSSISLT